ncbi:MAG: hypothetical protein AAGE96_03220 [Cyanobacteria bacterium P01_G01_bin.19]
MSKFKSLSVNRVVGVAIAILISFCFMSSAMAITQKLQFDSDEGYTVTAVFSYDKSLVKDTIKERGHGKTAVIDTMKVSFYNPSNEPIANYDNIIDGVVVGDYFEFNFDPATQQLAGNIDIGGESAGEMYLKGEAEQELLLIEVSQSGSEKAIASLRKRSL